MKKKIIIRGPILTISGYGEHTKFVLRSLRKFNDLFDVYITPCNWGATSWSWIDDEERKWIDEIIKKTIEYINQGGKFDISVQVTIPNELSNLATTNILVTAGTETTHIAPQWIEKCNPEILKKIIVPSEHAKAAFVNTSFTAENNLTKEIIKDYRCPVSVEVIGYPIYQYKPLEDYSELKFESDFNFLCVAQWGPRKNIENTIKWFVEEFIDCEDVGLVLKLSLRNNCHIDKLTVENKLTQLLAKYPQKKCKIYLIHGYMKEDENALLYTHPKIKAIINIANGEAWSLPLWSAVCSELPVITVDWGGQKDFLYAPSKSDKELKPCFAMVDYEVKPIQPEAVWDGVLQKESFWSFADAGSYKMKLREVKREYPRFKQQAKRLQKYILEKFETEKQYHIMAEAIYGETIKIVNVEELPKVSIITSVFRGKDFIEGFFEDIVKQTIFDNKIELILIHPKDSPDFDFEQKIIRKYINNYSNIVYKQIEQDKGLYNCWNEGIKLSTGEYVGNRNLDDRLYIQQIEKCAKELYLNQDIAGVYFDFLITQKPNETFEKNTSEGRRYNFPMYSFQILKSMNLLHAAPLWRKNLHEKYGYFDEGFRSVSDWKWFLVCGAGGEKFKKIDECLGLYFFNPKGISTNPENNSWKRKEERIVYEQFKNVNVEEK